MSMNSSSASPAGSEPASLSALTPEVAADAFVVDLDGFEGPIDLLLALARSHKVDLARISILALADQYLAFLERARVRNLDIAAEYLVMAAWLAFLKSRLLLPEPEAEDEEDAQELADALQRRLVLLDAIRKAAALLEARPRLGRERLARGMPEGVRVQHDDRFALGLFELVDAYRRTRPADRDAPLVIRPPRLHSLQQALRRITALLGGPDWQDLARFLPDDDGDPLFRRSALASSLVAGLELARDGQAEIRQAQPFGPVLIRRRPR